MWRKTWCDGERLHIVLLGWRQWHWIPGLGANYNGRSLAAGFLVTQIVSVNCKLHIFTCICLFESWSVHCTSCKSYLFKGGFTKCDPVKSQYIFTGSNMLNVWNKVFEGRSFLGIPSFCALCSVLFIYIGNMVLVPFRFKAPDIRLKLAK